MNTVHKNGSKIPEEAEQIWAEWSHLISSQYIFIRFSLSLSHCAFCVYRQTFVIFLFQSIPLSGGSFINFIPWMNIAWKITFRKHLHQIMHIFIFPMKTILKCCQNLAYYSDKRFIWRSSWASQVLFDDTSHHK